MEKYHSWKQSLYNSLWWWVILSNYLSNITKEKSKGMVKILTNLILKAARILSKLLSTAVIHNFKKEMIN